MFFEEFWIVSEWGKTVATGFATVAEAVGVLEPEETIVGLRNDGHIEPIGTADDFA